MNHSSHNWPPELDKDGKKFFKERWFLFKFLIKNGLKTFIYLKILWWLIYTWKNPFDVRKVFIANSTWLKVNAIIWNPLYHPWSGEDSNIIIFSSTKAGLWNTYDFYHKRFIVKEKRTSQFYQGMTLYFFPLEEVEKNELNELTPNGLLDITNIDQIIHFTRFSVLATLDFGAIIETTYGEALERVGNIKLLEDAKKLWIENQKVYQVTPKGNSLIIPSKSWWDKSPPLPKASPEGEGVWSPVKV